MGSAVPAALTRQRTFARCQQVALNVSRRHVAKTLGQQGASGRFGHRQQLHELDHVPLLLRHEVLCCGGVPWNSCRISVRRSCSLSPCPWELARMLANCTVRRPPEGGPIVSDVFSDVLSRPELCADKIHPNAMGYRHMASGLFARFRKIGFLR